MEVLGKGLTLATTLHDYGILLLIILLGGAWLMITSRDSLPTEIQGIRVGVEGASWLSRRLRFERLAFMVG